MKVILTGGGTGGHVYPSLAIMEIIRKNYPEAEFLYLGVKGKAEEFIINSLSDDEKIPFEFISASGLPRTISPGQLTAFFRNLITGFLKSRKLINNFRPDIIIAAGGYVSAPVILAGRFCGVKLLLHEQNSAPGLVNKFLGRIATKVLITFENSSEFFNRNKTVLSGYPVRRRISARNKFEARKELGIAEDARVVFVFGGSSGAKAINEAVAGNLDFLLSGRNIVLIHGTGKDRPGFYNAFSETVKMYDDFHSAESGADKYILKDYFNNIDTIYSAADLVVCRAGAGTIMECAAMGIPALLVPKRGLPGNHQEKNAQTAMESGGVVVVKEEYHKKRTILDGENLSETLIDTLFNDDKLREMSENIRKLYLKKSDEIIIGEIRNLLAG